ncbi:unnamed protein product [Phytomonas sp. Hart1]|nr:unnamed protein product [Phytomonas sp. Hart1]|eukprot:CCW68011.1 unnamed protein product [Phytomonas sp. isolate Hart1]
MTIRKPDKLNYPDDLNHHDTSATEVLIIPERDGLRPWHYNLFTCCWEANSCLEANFCFYCQLSRQHNMLYNLTPQIDIPMCVLTAFLDYATISCFSFFFQFSLRRNIRQRYGIKGNVLKDCLSTYLCGPCALQQQLLEMTSQGSFPGATFYNYTNIPSQVHML